jgi:release factor glutamine methyltransferase
VPAVLVSEALRQAENEFRNAGIEAPRVQATALLGHAMQLDRAGLLARLRDPLAAAELRRYRELTTRRAAHEPLQYLLGRADFLDFTVRVAPGVFIPRPETEQLVELALAAWDPEYPRAIDLCAGSGAISIALARARPQARVLAIDLSPVAIQSARNSARDLAVDDRIDFLRADLLTPVRPRGPWRERIGCLVCNPPYAAAGEVVQPEVANHEPELAWLAGTRGTEIYERLVPAAAWLLAPGRPLLFELGYGQSGPVRELLEQDGRWDAVSVAEDFQGIDRVLTAIRR